VGVGVVIRPCHGDSNTLTCSTFLQSWHPAAWNASCHTCHTCHTTPHATLAIPPHHVIPAAPSRSPGTRPPLSGRRTRRRAQGCPWPVVMKCVCTRVCVCACACVCVCVRGCVHVMFVFGPFADKREKGLQGVMLAMPQHCTRNHQACAHICCKPRLFLRPPQPQSPQPHLCLGVEGDDVFHDIRVGVPIQSLEVVGGHEVHVLVPRHAWEQGVEVKSICTMQ